MSRLKKESSFGNAASASQEGLEEGPRVSQQPLRVTLLSSEWRSLKGGLATIGRELAIQFAKHSNVEVCVYLPKCSEEDRNDAASQSVQVIEAEDSPGVDPVSLLASVPTNHAMDCIIGHGVHLGRQIPIIQRQHVCKWIQVVHTAPEELGMYKSYKEAIFKGEQEHQAEVKLCELADQVVAVGPKLADAYSRYLRFSGKDQDVINLIPSVFKEFQSVQQATEERSTFCVLVFGRGDSEDFKLKGYDIAVQAVTELKDTSYQLMFVGAPTGKEDEVASKLLEYGICPSQLTVRRFKESREELPKLFCEVDLAIMPSRTEGFGLTALQALSAGLPVLVSGNSGLGHALKNFASGSSHVVDSQDPKEWAKAIKSVRQKGREVRLEEANLLREKYAEKYSWGRQCDDLVNKMWHLTFGSSSTDQPSEVDSSVLHSHGACAQPVSATVHLEEQGGIKQDFCQVQASKPSQPFEESVILTNENHRRVLKGWLPSHLGKWRLLFRASRDGFAVAAFHFKCDNKGPTVTIVKSGDNIFGGFTEESWCSTVLCLGGWKTCRDAFLFSMVNPRGLGPTKMPLKTQKKEWAISGDLGWGPLFGGGFLGGHDLIISNYANVNTLSYSCLGHTYERPPEQPDTFFTGSRYFTVEDYEVFGLQA